MIIIIIDNSNNNNNNNNLFFFDVLHIINNIMLPKSKFSGMRQILKIKPSAN
jgi:hypothetical protein